VCMVRATRPRKTPNIIIEDDEEGLSVSSPELVEEAAVQPEEIPLDVLQVEPEPIPETVEAVEIDVDGAQIFQSYEEDVPIESESTQVNDLEEVEPESPASTDIVLLDYFPTTPEEYQQGYRRISLKEKKAWGITQAEDEYDTLPGMAATLGVSRNTAETWIYQCFEHYPSGFLKTRHGLTTECLKVLQLYQDYCGGENYSKSRKNRFLRKLEEQREQYEAHMQAHREKSSATPQEESSALAHIPAVEGEFVDESTQLQIQVSFARSDRSFESAIDDYATGKVIHTICDVYKKVSGIKPLMDKAIQNGLTGQDLPDLSKIITKD